VKDDADSTLFQRPERHFSLPVIRSPGPNDATITLSEARQDEPSPRVTHGLGAVGTLDTDPYQGFTALNIHDHTADDAVGVLSLRTSAERPQEERH